MLKWFLSFLQKSFEKRITVYNAKLESLTGTEHDQLFSKISNAQKTIGRAQTEFANIGFFSRIWITFKAWRAFNALEKACEKEQTWSEAFFEMAFLLGLIFVMRHFIFGLYHTPTCSAEPNILVGDRILGVKYPYLFDKKNKIKHGDLVIFDDVHFKYDQTNFLNKMWQKYAGWFDLPLLGLTAGPQSWVKRVIAKPGDVVEGRVENGRTEIYLNGKKLNEPYLNPHPLICLQREVGIFPESWGMPHWLTTRPAESPLITYNPEYPYDKQPFYCFDDNEIKYRTKEGKPLLWIPREPSNGDVFGPLRVPEGKIWCMGDNRRGSADSRAWGFVKIDTVFARASRILWSVDSNESFWLIDIIKHPLAFFKKKVRWSRFGRSLHPFEKVYTT